VRGYLGLAICLRKHHPGMLMCGHGEDDDEEEEEEEESIIGEREGPGLSQGSKLQS